MTRRKVVQVDVPFGEDQIAEVDRARGKTARQRWIREAALEMARGRVTISVRPALKLSETEMIELLARATPWSGLCPAGKHGLDFEGQDCDVCLHDRGGPCTKICRRCFAARTRKLRI